MFGNSKLEIDGYIKEKLQWIIFFFLLYCENEISLVFKVFFMHHGFIIENAFRSCANFPSLLLYHIIIIILWYYIIPLGILVGTRKNFHNANVSIIPAL